MERIISTFEKAIIAKSRCGEVVYLSLESAYLENNNTHSRHEETTKKIKKRKK